MPYDSFIHENKIAIWQRNLNIENTILYKFSLKLKQFSRDWRQPAPILMSGFEGTDWCWCRIAGRSQEMLFIEITVFLENLERLRHQTAPYRVFTFFSVFIALIIKIYWYSVYEIFEIKVQPISSWLRDSIFPYRVTKLWGYRVIF